MFLPAAELESNSQSKNLKEENNIFGSPLNFLLYQFIQLGIFHENLVSETGDNLSAITIINAP